MMISANRHLAQPIWANSTMPRLNPRLCRTNNCVKLTSHLGGQRRRPATFSLPCRHCRQHRCRQHQRCQRPRPPGERPRSCRQRCSPAAPVNNHSADDRNKGGQDKGGGGTTPPNAYEGQPPRKALGFPLHLLPNRYTLFCFSLRLLPSVSVPSPLDPWVVALALISK